MNKEPISKDLQIVGLVFAVMLTAILVDKGGSIDGGFWLFMKSLPACAIGLAIYKTMAKHEFQMPESWPEWIMLYYCCLLIGGPVVILIMFLFKQVFH